MIRSLPTGLLLVRRRLAATGLAALLLLPMAGCSPGADLPLVPDYAAQRYRLGGGDQVRIITFGEDQLTGDFRVDDQGQIALPLLGSVQAAGLTTQELDRRISSELQARKMLSNASVTSEVLAYRPIFVLGEVAKPGQYPYQPGMTMLTAVAVAGGFTYRAVEDYASVIRTPSDRTSQDRAAAVAPTVASSPTADPAAADATPGARKAVEGRILPSSFIAPGDVIKVFQRRF